MDFFIGLHFPFLSRISFGVESRVTHVVRSPRRKVCTSISVKCVPTTPVPIPIRGAWSSRGGTDDLL